MSGANCLLQHLISCLKWNQNFELWGDIKLCGPLQQERLACPRGHYGFLPGCRAPVTGECGNPLSTVTACHLKELDAQWTLWPLTPINRRLLTVWPSDRVTVRASGQLTPLLRLLPAWPHPLSSSRASHHHCASAASAFFQSPPSRLASSIFSPHLSLQEADCLSNVLPELSERKQLFYLTSDGIAASVSNVHSIVFWKEEGVKSTALPYLVPLLIEFQSLVCC